MATKAIIYARVSTLKQADEGLPIESQIEQCTRRAAQLDADVVRVFRDDGISGRKSSRPAFQEAIDYCGIFDIDYFITWNTARFARNRIDAAGYKQILRKGGTKVVYVANDIDGESEEGWLLEGLVELMDEQYSRTISKDTRRSMIKNAHDGYYNGGGLPFGYASVADGKRRRLTIADQEAPLVREVFYQYLGGAGLKTIAVALNDAGRLRRGFKWTKQHVRYMLTNWVYAGYITYNRQDHAAKAIRPESDWIRTKAHAAIIAEEDFMAVQQLFASHSPAKQQGSPKSRFLFTGLLRCGACDMVLQIETGTGRSKVYSYYNCRGARIGTGCENRRLPANDLDDWLLQFVLDKLFTPQRIAEIAQQIYEIKGRWVKDRETKRAALVAEMRNAESRRRRIFEVLELHGRDAPNMADLAVRLRGHNERIRGIERDLTELEAQPAPEIEITQRDLEEIADFIRQLFEESREPAKLREFLSTIIEKVMIGDTEAVIHYRPEKIMSAGGGGLVQSAGPWHPNNQ